MSNELQRAIQPKSDQLNSDDLISGPRTITITRVKVSPGEQPVVINFEGDDGKPYKPSKGMTRVMVLLWGDDETKWIGRSVTLFRNADVKWGGVKVGGIQISHASGIKNDVQIAVTMSKGKKELMTIYRLAEAKKPAPEPQVETVTDTGPMLESLRNVAANGMADLKTAWAELPANIRKAISPTGCPEELKTIATAADAAKGGE